MDKETKDVLIKLIMFHSRKSKWPVSEWIARLVLEHMIKVGCFNG